jgi:sugar/nucleoside kinase (ribokinase family)
MRISALGCCLIDYLYGDYNYQFKEFQSLSSVYPGDGGLIKGGLVFAEDLEKFGGKPFPELLDSLVRGTSPMTNLGGPAIISLIHVSQILHNEPISCRFFGIVGKDFQSALIAKYLGETTIEAKFIKSEKYPTPTTHVLSDRLAEGGKGDRSFINVIGAAGALHTRDIPDDFFNSDLFILGGTALLPSLHKELEILLSKAKHAGSVTIVGTIFDFKNERKDPVGRWPYGKQNAYFLTDLLVCDAQEAIRLSGTSDVESAAKWLIKSGVSAFIITQGSKDTTVWSSSDSLFGANELRYYPVCNYIDDMIHKDPALLRDTTGCGDNFLGGVIISIARQRIGSSKKNLDLQDLVIWGEASGGLALLFHGGMFHEINKGQKEQLLQPIVQAYRKQLGGIIIE